MHVPGFGPAAEVLLFRQKAPKPLTPHPFLSNWTDAMPRKAGQLARLRQGSPLEGGVQPWKRAAGVGQWKKSRRQGIQYDKVTYTGLTQRQECLEIIWNHYKRTEFIRQCLANCRHREGFALSRTDLRHLRTGTVPEPRDKSPILDLGRCLFDRGAKDAPKNKEFILPLIFTKRLCDVSIVAITECRCQSFFTLPLTNA